MGAILTLKRAEKVLGEPATKWAGRCYEIACRLVDRGAVKGVAVYGHWLGPVHPKSRFYRTGPLFVQHGWVILPDKRVLDPTRWVFEHIAPYLYIGPADHYDEGGTQFRAATSGLPPRWDPEEEQHFFDYTVLPYGTAWAFIEKLLRLDRELDRPDYEPGQMSDAQLFWLANADPAMLGVHAATIYAAIDKLGRRALIPLDNWLRVQRERALQENP